MFEAKTFPLMLQLGQIVMHFKCHFDIIDEMCKWIYACHIVYDVDLT